MQLDDLNINIYTGEFVKVKKKNGFDCKRWIHLIRNIWISVIKDLNNHFITIYAI